MFDFKINEQDINSMESKDVVEEFKSIESALNHEEEGWYGFASAFHARIEARRLQLIERMAKEYMKSKVRKKKQ